MTAGPPVVNENTAGSTDAPLLVFSWVFTLKLQRTPAGRSRSKSNTQFFGSAQRALPCSGQSMSKGSARRGSPKATMASEKRTATWRTPLTSPCGENNSTLAANAGAESKTAASATARGRAVIEGPLGAASAAQQAR